MSQVKPFCFQVTVAVAGKQALSTTSRKILSALVSPASTNAGTVTVGDTTNQFLETPVALPFLPFWLSPSTLGQMDLADVFIKTTSDGDKINVMGYELA